MSKAYALEQETTWFKIRNKRYSQWVGREQLFERERKSVTDEHGWNTCARAPAVGV